MSSPTNPTPWPNLFEIKVAIITEIFGPMMSSLIDETGAAFTVPVTSEYAATDFTAPQIVVGLRPGNMQMATGENLINFNETTQQFVRGFLATDSAIVFNILARSNPERLYILDALVSAIVASYYINPTTNQRGDDYAIRALAAFGIVVNSINRFDIPEVNYAEPRLESQIYTATLSVGCDVQVVWSTPGVQAGFPATITPSFQYPSPSFPIDPTGASWGDPNITVN